MQPEWSKPGKEIIIERIVNIGDIEALIERSYLLAQFLEKEFQTTEITDTAKSLVSDLVRLLKQAHEFDYILEHRHTTVKERS